MKKLLLAVNLFAFSLMGCKKDVPVLSPENALPTFQFLAANNLEEISNDITCIISDTLIAGVTGNNNSRANLVASFTSTGMSVTVNNIAQVSGETKNDFTNPVVYVVKAKNGIEKKYTVKLQAFTGLPILYISTEGPILSTVDYVKGTMNIDGNLAYTEGLYDGKIEMRGRGNSTWFVDKRPYKIKLDKKAVILGMPADKEWALLANYFDKTLIRNDVGFELSERLGLAWTPRRRFVEVFLNNVFLGNYLLTETVKTGKDRLNITPMDIKNPNDTTSDFLVETDQRLDGAQSFITPTLVPIVLKEPDPASNVQFNFIKNQILAMEDHIGNLTDMRSELDLDSWIKWIIVNEVMRNRDAVLFGSCFFYKTKGKINMGPVWDLDLSSGGYTGNDPEGWYVHTANWIGGLFYYHPYYKQRFKEIWIENYNSIVSINKYIKSESQLLQYSEKKNFTAWNIMNTSTYEGQIVSGSYQNEIDHLSGFLDKRISWINTQVRQW